MADQFDKATILNKLKAKVQAKGFDLNPDKSKMSNNVPTILDMLDIIAESVADLVFVDQNKDGTITAKEVKIGPDGLQQPHAYKNAKIKFDATTDPKFFAWMEALHAVIRGVYPEPGSGAPDTFARALKVLLSKKPKSLTGKIIEGSKKVKVTT
jgi:hypothetical protein